VFATRANVNQFVNVARKKKKKLLRVNVNVTRANVNHFAIAMTIAMIKI
jgi:hypothetical protein